jgi:trehalose-6-phosphate synthase
MRLSIRFILPLFLVLGFIAYLTVPLVDKITEKWFMRDIQMRSELVLNSIHESLVQNLIKKSKPRLKALFARVLKDERIYAVGFCTKKGELLYKTDFYPSNVIACDSIDDGQAKSTILNIPSGMLYVFTSDVIEEGQSLGKLVLMNDMSYMQRRSSETKRYLFYLFIATGIIIAFITVLIAQLSWRGWVRGIRALIKGERLFGPISKMTNPSLSPIMKDLKTLVRELEAERKTKDELQVSWTPYALKQLLHNDLSGDEVIIVSNRQPYIHVKDGDKIKVQVPASGLVTALEPILRACSGTWVAHGSGTADKETVDSKDHVRVPPNDPSYNIRRVWLSEEEEKGYYYGFSNEGIWPLCHMAHVRPIFRAEDWKHYVAINKRFADVVVEESKTKDPVVLVQDYHLALVPRFIREKLPNATIMTFWHIPWPNAEAFSICPWREEIIKGLLGSSILGFHTRFHCNNFLSTADKFVECKIDWDATTISYGGELTAIKNYPISIEWPPRWIEGQKSIAECRVGIRSENDLRSDVLIGVGVDRMDYTKGILERFMSVERLLDLNSEWRGKFSFIQIAAPTRMGIYQYQQFEKEVEDLAIKINEKYSEPNYKPIVLRAFHHNPDEVFRYFRGAEFCFVSSLHDGMNLVAKEFVSSRDDERGVLILSQFTGASTELPESIIVNPYDIDQCAAAISLALEMPESEQRERMRVMRGLVQEFNVYRWAGKMLLDASRIRQQNKFKTKFKYDEISNT